MFDGITSALYAPNSNGIVGDVARAVSPQVAYQIGQHFKQNNTEQSASHGNGLGDKTSLSNRQSVPMSKKIFGININVGPSKMIFGKLPLKTTQPKAMGVNSILGEKIKQAKNKFDKSQKICEND